MLAAAAVNQARLNPATSTGPSRLGATFCSSRLALPAAAFTQIAGAGSGKSIDRALNPTRKALRNLSKNLLPSPPPSSFMAKWKTTIFPSPSPSARWTARRSRDAPLSASVVTRDLLNDQVARLLSDVVKNDASVGDDYVPVGYYGDYEIRGFPIDLATGLEINGMTIAGEQDVPLENKERVEILKGHCRRRERRGLGRRAHRLRHQAAGRTSRPSILPPIIAALRMAPSISAISSAARSRWARASTSPASAS